MAGMSETCTVCGRGFEVQFRYQMEEREDAFSFFCSQKCHGRSLRGEITSGVVCGCCNKRFVVDLVSQVVRIKGETRYACSEGCRSQLLAEASGLRLGNATIADPGSGGSACRGRATGGAATPRNGPPPSQTQPVASRPAPPPAAQEVTIPERPSAASDAAEVVAAPSAATSSRLPAGSAGGTVTAMRPFASPRKMAIFNHKGGTGKTTTSVSIAAGLALKGYRVLLVDTDSQGNVGVSLGLKTDKTLYHVLVMGLRPQDVAVTVRENFDVLPSNETLAAAELYLAGRQNRDRVLRDRLAAAQSQYDVVLLDCSPSLSLLNQNALVFADGILVPVACDFLSLVGVRQVIKTVKNVNGLLHHPVQIHGVLPTFYDARARICRDAWGTLKEHFGDRCFQPVRAATRVKEAPAQGKTIFEYAPESNAASDYRQAVERLVTGRCTDVDVDADADEAMAG
jgi:chromosome partitioning protein